MAPRIYVLCPDDNTPSAPMRRLYRLVEVLARHGFEAAALHQQDGFRCTWFEHTTKVVSAGSTAGDPPDYLVVPELYGPRIAALAPGIKKVIFHQDSRLTFRGHAQEVADLRKSYTSPEVVAALVLSEYDQRVLQHAFPELHILLIRPAINNSLFAYRVDKKPRIGILPGKEDGDTAHVLSLLRLRDALTDFEVVPVPKCAEAEGARLLGECLIVLSLDRSTTQPWLRTEAMASGCLVVGYPSPSDRDYFDSESAYPVEPGDCLGCAHAVEEVIRQYRSDPEPLRQKAERAAALLRERCSAEQEEQDLLEAWRTILSLRPPTPIVAVPSPGASGSPQGEEEELTSIIVLCCNALHYTRLCLESVVRHTRPPYELVVVDNASGDGTPAFLEEVRAWAGPVRVEILRNETNRGFAAGCNQALGHTRGHYLLFLNNDTVVTEGWLEGLLACLEQRREGVGLVGPVTNLIEVPQQIPIDYTDLHGMVEFAAHRRREFAGQVLEVEKLSGFCLLARREVLERAGGFDERYGLGYYEDHDLSFRARDAGFRLLVAQDVFVHHFGGRTFAALEIDGRQPWYSNLERFRAKWGEERTAGYPRLQQPRDPTQGVPEPLPSAVTEVSARKPGVVWHGPQAAVHSLAHVNRQLCLKLLERGHLVSLVPTDDREPETPRLSVPQLLRERFQLPVDLATVIHVRHQWPPDFTSPAAGHWVVMQPWEFGSLPRAWIGPLAGEVDEVWVYTQYLRDCYVRSGIPGDRVQVVPLGVDTARFHPEVTPLPLATRKRFKFVFVGGTIHRKGIDLLLAAYARSFTDQDDVCLVIKDMGGGSFYRGQTAEKRVAEHQRRPGAPEIEYLDRNLTEEELAGLYTACDCLVLPYRGEGFGLPVAEAMACGRPVLVTGYGAALDFCDDTTAFLIPARVVHFPDKRLGDVETVDYPWLAEPDVDALQSLLRAVIEQPELARAKGQAGAARIRSGFTWEQAAAAVEQRLDELRRRPVRRLSARPNHGARAPSSASLGARPRVSLCMIVKNEEANLPACLESVADLADEMVIVDTGSADRTKDVALRYGARVFDFPWVDSFAAARNESLRNATGDWLFWLDADDRLDDENRRKLGDLFSRLPDEHIAYSMKCRCLPDPNHTGATVVDHVRLFRNHPELRWRYRVHEQILPAVRHLGGKVCFTDIVIEHVGYQDPSVRARKLQRDLRLLQLEHAEQPDDPFTLFNLGAVHHEMGKFEQALPFLMRSLERSHPSDSIVRKLYALIAQCHCQLGQRGAALVACRAGRTFCSDDAELLFQEGMLLRELGERAAAIGCFLRLLHGGEGPHFASVDAGLRGYKAQHNLASLYQEDGHAADAESLWRQALAEQPDFGPAWLGLAELLLAQARWAEFGQIVERLETTSPNGVEAAVLRARACMARKEYPQARQLLEATIVREPRHVWPRVVLSHALLQEGRDWEAAEQALRAVLALDPDNAGARRNLDVLCKQQERNGEKIAVQMLV